MIKWIAGGKQIVCNRYDTYLLVDAITTTLSFVVRRPSHSYHITLAIQDRQHTQHTAENKAKEMMKFRIHSTTYLKTQNR